MVRPKLAEGADGWTPQLYEALSGYFQQVHGAGANPPPLDFRVFHQYRQFKAPVAPKAFCVRENPV